MPLGVVENFKTNLLIADLSATDQLVAFGKTKHGELIITRQVLGSLAHITILIPYTDITAAEMVCCYILVLSEDGKQVSNSVYITLV